MTTEPQQEQEQRPDQPPDGPTMSRTTSLARGETDQESKHNDNINSSNNDTTKRQLGLLQQVITAATVCSPEEFCPDMNEIVNLDLFHSTMDAAKVADKEVQKGLAYLAKQMTVNKAIVQDAEVISILMERLFS